MTKTTLQIGGMHCRACEVLLEERISKVPGVEKVTASTRKSELSVWGEFDSAMVQAEIVDLGYQVTNQRPLLYSKDIGLWLRAVLTAILVLIVYSLIFVSGALPGINITAIGVWGSLTLGLVAGVSTCMALVGGMVMTFTAKYREDYSTIQGIGAFIPNIFFNVGRVGGFFVLGGLLGVLGGSITISPYVNGLLILMAAVMMLLIGIDLSGLSPRIAGFRVTLPNGASKVTRYLNTKYTHGGAVTLGVLSFFLPCGFTQAVQVTAVASGGFLQGGLLMAAFALGTTPGLLAVGGLVSFIRSQSMKKVFQIIGVVVIMFALIEGVYALNMFGIRTVSIGFLQPKAAAVTMENGVQIARMEVTQYGYTPNKFIVQKGVPIRWVVDVKDISTCASYLWSPDLDISQLLKRGVNTFDFTPKQSGAIHFSCSMGMYTGDFIVN